jgi:hypothetical protein
VFYLQGLHNLYSSPIIIIRVLKSRAGHVARMGEVRMYNMKGTNHSKDLDVKVRIILEWILEKHGGKLWTSFIWLKLGSIGGLL